jgi:hypothetical protein
VSPIADWAIDVIAANPVLAALAPTVFVAVWCGLNAISRQVERLRERRAEAVRQADLDTCNAILKLPSPRKETP